MKRPVPMYIQDEEYYVQVDATGAPLTGEIKRVDVVVKEIPRQGFAITYLSSIVQMIDAIGNRKMGVVKYLLSHMDSNNKISETEQEIANHSGISRQTVHDTLLLLESAGVIARKTGTVMLSPKLAHKGNAARERFLMTKFVEIKKDAE